MQYRIAGLLHIRSARDRTPFRGQEAGFSLRQPHVERDELPE
jgi:hypothetical protein